MGKAELLIRSDGVNRVAFIKECGVWQIKLQCGAFVHADVVAANESLVCAMGELNTVKCAECGAQCPVHVGQEAEHS